MDCELADYTHFTLCMVRIVFPLAKHFSTGENNHSAKQHL